MPEMSRQPSDESTADFWNDTDLQTIPEVLGYFSRDDLRGSLEGMPDFKPSTEVFDSSVLQSAIDEHYSSLDVTASKKQEQSGKSSVSKDKKPEAAPSQTTLGLDDARPPPQSPKFGDIFEIDGYDGTDTRSNPETPMQPDSSFVEGPTALKRVQSEQGTGMLSRMPSNSPLLRLSESDRAQYINGSLQNTSRTRHHRNASYVVHNPRPMSRLRETTPMVFESQTPATGQHVGQELAHEFRNHNDSNINNNNTLYRQDQQPGHGPHMEQPQYPDPSVLEVQNVLSQMPYLGQQNRVNVNESILQPYQNHHHHSLQHSQQLATEHRPSLSHTYQSIAMMKQESPEHKHGGLVYSSAREAHQDKGVNTLALNDSTVPHTDAHKLYYVMMLKTAMMDMDYAEDNAGMVATWNKMRIDGNKVEQACWALVEVVMRAYDPTRGGPLVAGAKCVHKYESFQKRIEALVEGLRTQKTMCKHIMAPPYIDQLVDDPLNAITRIKNNRKVNHGKKVAIQKGRSALGEKGQGKGRRNIKLVQEDEYEDDGLGVVHDNLEADCDFDDDEEAVAEATVQYQAATTRGNPTKRPRRTESEESQDPSYGSSRVPSKKPKRASRSKYQMNHRNEMVDTTLEGQGISPRSEASMPQYGVSDPQYGTPNPQYGISSRIDPQYGQRQPNHHPNLRQQAFYQNNRQNPSTYHGNAYLPTQPPSQLIPQSQAMLKDFDDFGTTADLTPGNEEDNEHYYLNEYGSDIQPRDAGGHSQRR